MNASIDTWFNNLERLQSVGLGAIFFYLLIVFLTRVVGKRTTGQMNNFDWIVTVAVGSLAASGILLKNVSVADATFAIIILFFLQWLTTWLVMRSEFVCRLVKARPRLLLHQGKLRAEALKKERISEAEIYTVLREQGLTHLSDASWVILENDGRMTVIPQCGIPLESAQLMKNVEHDLQEPKRSGRG